MADAIYQLPNNESTTPAELTDVIALDVDPSGTPVTEKRELGEVQKLLARSLINAQTGTTYTLVAADASKVVTCTNASAITVTVPNSTFAAGEKVMIVQGGAGSVTLSAGAGVTLNNPSSVDLEIAEENGARVLFFTSASEATVI